MIVVMAKHAGGRPVEYNPKLAKKADAYLKLCRDEEKQLVKQSNSEKGYETYENKLKVKLPTLEGFARYIGVHKSTLYDWDQKYDEFSDSLDKIRIEQQERLINSGLSGEYNSTIAKLILSSNHGYREKSDMTTDGEKINVAVINYAEADKDSDDTIQLS